MHQFFSFHVLYCLHLQRTWRWQRVPRSSRKLKPRCQQRVTWNVGCLFLVFVAGVGVAGGASGAGVSGFILPGTWNCPDILGLQKPSKEGPNFNQNRGHLGSRL